MRTRKQGRNPASTLDIMFTNVSSTISKTTLHPSSSDHLLICYEKNNAKKIKEPSSRRCRTFKKYTPEGMNKLINQEMLESLLSSADTNLVANVLTYHITGAINSIAPFVTLQPRKSYAPYLTADTKREMEERDILKKIANESNTLEDCQLYKRPKT